MEISNEFGGGWRLGKRLRDKSRGPGFRLRQVRSRDLGVGLDEWAGDAIRKSTPECTFNISKL
jgi:hypothetical protein